MVGLMQIMIYLLCVYLIYKGLEIFQIAFTSSAEQGPKYTGILIGLGSIVAAVIIGVIAVFFTESITSQMQNNMRDLPRFP